MCNACFLSVPRPDVFWYRLNGMSARKNAPKKILVTLFPYIFLVKTIVYEYLKTIFFHETQISFPKCIEHQIFLDPEQQPLGIFRYH